ncbi:hypothetical protein [Bradyrhizobium liaoningense]
MLCTVVAGDAAAFVPSTGTFAATLRSRYGVDAVVPVERFDPKSSRALFPGSTIVNVNVNALADKSKVLGLAAATICPMPGIKYGRGQATARHKQSPSREMKSNGREAMLLFGFDGDTLGSLKGYSLELSQPRLFRMSFDLLNEFSARSGADTACAPKAGNRSVISQSLVATVDVTIISRRPLTPHQLDTAARTLSPDSPVTFQKAAGDEFAYSARLPDRWVGIATEQRR